MQSLRRLQFGLIGEYHIFKHHIDYCCPSHLGPLPDCGSFEIILRTTGVRFTITLENQVNFIVIILSLRLAHLSL